MTNRFDVRRCLRAWTGAVLGAIALASGAAQAAEYSRGPAPTWVQQQPLDRDAKAPLGQASNGIHYLLADQQTQLDPQGQVSYRRLASRALNERGVSSVGQISMEFDPSYQQLTLHELRVIRDGRVQDRLPSAQIKVLQRESELEYRVYDGSKTIDIVLDDIRVGDVVDYSYSVKGANPVFGGRGFGAAGMRWGAPVHRLHRRLRAPVGREIWLKTPEGAPSMEKTEAAGWVERIWQADHVAPFSRQHDTPSWYDPYATIQWSEFADWAAVARWAEPLYTAPDHLTGALRTEVDRIAAQSERPEDRLREVLAFVQSQIRYLGVEMGPGSHAPRSPETVLARRYGDCKDKVRLSVVMLRALGVTAYPALVDTDLRQAVADQLPSPGAFNHVILQARVGDTTYWLDPTRSTQKGGLDQLAQASFGRALLLDGRSTGLATMPVPPGAQYRREIAMSIDASKGFGQAVTMQVRTTYDGASADEMRETLRNDNIEDLQRNYLNYYLRSYPGLSQDKPLAFEDDEAANRLVTTESYRIDSLWAKNPPGDKPVVYLFAPDMKSALNRPDDTVRTAPLALEHPEDLIVKVTAVLPEPRSIKASTQQVHSSAFEFDEQTSTDDRTLNLMYRYRSLADHVGPADMAKHLVDLESARRLVGFTLPMQKSASARSSWTWPAIACAALAIALFGWAAGCALEVSADRRLFEDPAIAPAPVSRILMVGHGLLHAPFWGLLFLAPVVWVLTRHVEGAWLPVMLVAFALNFVWRACWTYRWIAWSGERAADPGELRARALARRLPAAESVARAEAPATNASPG